MYGSWTEKEVLRFQKRELVFLRERLNPLKAEKLAEQMLYRDRPEECDDRRLCFECQHLDELKCKIKLHPLRFVLQRCDGFALIGRAK